MNDHDLREHLIDGHYYHVEAINPRTHNDVVELHRVEHLWPTNVGHEHSNQPAPPPPGFPT